MSISFGTVFTQDLIYFPIMVFILMILIHMKIYQLVISKNSIFI